MPSALVQVFLYHKKYPTITVRLSLQSAGLFHQPPMLSPSSVKSSFFVVYALLFGTALVTFIESLRTTSRAARHILNLETAVSLVAGFFYGVFVTMSQREDFALEAITPLRYMDWAITTPVLLLVFLLFFNYYNQEDLRARDLLIVVALNYVMLAAGYLAETGRCSRAAGGIFGFAAFFAMVAFIYTKYVHGAVQRHLLGVFAAFVAIWGAYGIAYMLRDEADKNAAYNVLDVCAKVGFGLYLWGSYGGVMAL